VFGIGLFGDYTTHSKIFVPRFRENSKSKTKHTRVAVMSYYTLLLLIIHLYILYIFNCYSWFDDMERRVQGGVGVGTSNSRVDRRSSSLSLSLSLSSVVSKPIIVVITGG
jgi:hypothetical protein